MKMKTSIMKSQFSILGCTNLTNPITKISAIFNKPTRIKLPKSTIAIVKTKLNDSTPTTLEAKPACQTPVKGETSHSRYLMVGAASVGVILFLLGMDDEHHIKAMALGPEGPLVEEFWDNVRRYALYALTVSTGALYTVLQPIVELLKNPISAILVLVIFGGSVYVVSQVLYAMVGVNEFNYEYGY